MKSPERIIHIKLQNSDALEEYETELWRWEGEGGTPTSLSDIIHDINLPLKKGQVFEVLDTDLVYEDGEVTFEVGLKFRH